MGLFNTVKHLGDVLAKEQHMGTRLIELPYIGGGGKHAVFHFVFDGFQEGNDTIGVRQVKITVPGNYLGIVSNTRVTY